MERLDDWVVYSKIKMVQLMICFNMMNIISWHPFMFSQSKVVPLTIVFKYLYSICRGCGLVDAAKGDVGYILKEEVSERLSISFSLSLSHFQKWNSTMISIFWGNIGNSITTSQNFLKEYVGE